MRSTLQVAWATSLLACTDPTQLVVVVDTDMGPGELDGFRITVTGPARVVERPAPGDEPFAVFHDGGVELPATFGVAPKGGAGHTVEVSIAAIRDGRDGQPDAELFRTRAVTGFIEHRMLRLDLFLARRCVTEAGACSAEETCTELGCVSPERPADSLPGWDGHAPPRRDAGPPPDAGTPLDASTTPDAAMLPDAAEPFDAAVDAGTVLPTPFFALVAEPTGQGSVWVDDVAVGDAGEVFVSGRYRGPATVQGVDAVGDAVRFAPFLAAWDAVGAPLWVKTPPQGAGFDVGPTALGFDPVTPSLIFGVEYAGAQLVYDDVPIGSAQNRNIAVMQIDPDDGSLLAHVDLLGGTVYLEGLAVSAQGQVALVADLSAAADAYDLNGSTSREEWDSWSALLATWGPGLSGVWTRLIRGTFASEAGAAGVDWTEADRLVVGGTFQGGLDWSQFRGAAPANGGGFLLGFSASCGADWVTPTILEQEHFRPRPVATGRPRDGVAAVFVSDAGTALIDGDPIGVAGRQAVLIVQRTPDGEPVDAVALWEGQMLSETSASPGGQLLLATESGVGASVHVVDTDLAVLSTEPAPGPVQALAGTASGLVAAAGRLTGEATREGVSIGAADARVRMYLWVLEPQP